MGAVSAKSARKSSCEGKGVNLNGCDFPNARSKSGEIASWSLLHQCTLDNWKQGHAEAANFPDSILSCDRNLYKDCSAAFCMSRQGVINIDCSTSMFSFKRRTKFSKMAEHFEYNHIPAQMSSINHFRVKSVLCFRESLVVLHLSRNGNSQFGILDLEINKFLGVFGNQPFEYENENISGELSPDRSKCLVLKPILADAKNGIRGTSNYSRITQACTEPAMNEIPECSLFSQDLQPPEEKDYFHMYAGSVVLTELLLYDMSSKHLLSRVPLADESCHFSFNPRHSWSCLALSNFGHETRENSLSLVEIVAPLPFINKLTSVSEAVLRVNSTMPNTKKPMEPVQNHSCIIDWTWNILSVNHRLADHWDDAPIIPRSTRGRTTSSGISPFQKLVNLQHSRDGRLLVATMLDYGECRCREKRSGFRDRRMSAGVEAPGGLRRGHRLQFQGGRHNQLPRANCSLYILDAYSAITLRCIQYYRYVCQLHTCPTNYVPIFSACGTRMALVVDAPADWQAQIARSDSQNFLDHSACKQSNQDAQTSQRVQVYRLPPPNFCLQALSRSVLLENKIRVSNMVVPPKILKYLQFGPEFY